MRFLANENVPGAAVHALAAAGHDVTWVGVAAPGIPDTDVLAWAIREDRILLTFDKDFANLVRRSVVPATIGVILFRTPLPRASEVGSYIAELITARDDWRGHFSVVEPGRVRMRGLQSG